MQRQLAAYLEIDTPMFSKIERGDRRAKRSQVIMLAEYFHVDEKEMLTLWLADKILDALEGEDSLALDAIGVAEKNNQTIKVKTIMERAEEHSNAFKRMAAFNNPEFYKLKSLRFGLKRIKPSVASITEVINDNLKLYVSDKIWAIILELVLVITLHYLIISLQRYHRSDIIR